MIKNMRLLFYFFIFLFFLGCNNNDTQKNTTTQTNRCVHCGMHTEKYEQWQGIIQDKGNTYSTCSPRCLLLTHIHNKKWVNADLWLKDYYDQKKINAKKAFFVAGSKILGPMGSDFIPLTTKKDATLFLNDNQGKKIFTFDEIDMKIIQQYQ
ncbi:MAG: hypothetical protein EAZ06_04520 [Cytophagales bacterium]|nr:MAG: hypothetical protein EAZ06_04520 [Cytophagales bacterium]